jgi:hypothetical protein
MSVEMAEAFGLVDVELAFGHHEDRTTAHGYAETREAVKTRLKQAKIDSL